MLTSTAENPTPSLDDELQKKLAAVQRVLLREFTELTSGELMEMRWHEERPTAADVRSELLETSDDPF